MKRALFFMAVVALNAPASQAGVLVLIGDIDGFGYGTAPGFRRANGGFANPDSLGVLKSGDFLPDINRNGSVATGNGDDFDLRSAAELANASLTAGTGVTNTTGTLGSKFTDISLSTSYDASRNLNQVLIGGNPNTVLNFGAGGAFPSPPSTTLPNQPGFVFRFEVDKTAINPLNSIFFNLVFGDYDVTPANINITRTNGSNRIINLATQSGAADGLIQAATATLNFNEVFTDGGTVWIGSLKVDFIAPNEPYTAFDYVELSTVALVSPVPEPASCITLGIGVVGLFGAIGRRRLRARTFESPATPVV